MRRLVLVSLQAGCSLGPLGPREVRGPVAVAAAPLLPAPFVVAEHAGRGGHLLFVDERGRRIRSLTEPPGAAATADLTPAFSPDARTLVFSSTRAAEGAGAGLWLVPSDGSAPPRRLTAPATGIDFQPAFAPDGRTLAFTASHGPGHSVWLLPLDLAGEPGAARLIMDGALAPAWSHRGDLLAVTRQVGPRDPAEIWLLAPDGGPARKLADGSGATFSPDDESLVFAAPAPGRADTDLWRVPRAGGAPVRLVDDPLGDEHDPRFSADGRFLFAEALVRDAGGRPVFPSIVYLDLTEPAPRLRALQDPLPGGWSSLAVAPVPLDAAALLRGPSYEEALARAQVAPRGN